MMYHKNGRNEDTDPTPDPIPDLRSPTRSLSPTRDYPLYTSHLI